MKDMMKAWFECCGSEKDGPPPDKAKPGTDFSCCDFMKQRMKAFLRGGKGKEGFGAFWVIMAGLAAASAFAHTLYVNPWYWALLRAVTGVCQVGLYMVVESWLNERAPKESRGRVFAVYIAVILAAGFGILSFSAFDMNAGMGRLTAITIVIALLVDFFFLPPLLLKIEGAVESETQTIPLRGDRDELQAVA